ncbi:MAG: zinc ribbon domain-containing protein [Acidobacteria bacterium]|nr:zinc ribbon domain-containing protein [Acidobacteriota bacterium]
MNCPNCGTPIQNDQQFCRSCGTQVAAAGPRRFDPRLAGLTMAFGGILIALAGSFVELRAVLFLGVIISIAGMFFIAAYPMLRSSLNRSSVAPINRSRCRTHRRPKSLRRSATLIMSRPVLLKERQTC